MKEIYDLVLDLKKRLTDSNIDITSSSNMSDKKICLAAGSMHYVYTYDPETNLFQSKNPGSKAGVFYGKAGNVSLVEPTADRLYLGQPFIIGASEYTDDLNLLTFITRVDALHIKEAKLSTEAMKKDSYEMVFGDENGQDGDILNGASILERFSKTESSNFF